MKKNNTKAKLLAGETVVGTFITINSIEIAKILSDVGYDYLVIDYEHGGMGIETLGQQILAIETSDTTPLVRIPSNTIDNIKKGLDAGAYGLMLPMVNTKEDVDKFVNMSNFPPIGIRGSGAVRANNFYSKSDDYFKFAETELLRIIQIETKEAVESIDEILSVGGIDVAFVGPFDLSFSLGCPGDILGEKVTESTEKVINACKKHGVFAGIMSNPKQLNHHIELGFKFILLNLDALHLFNGALNDLNLYRDTINKI